MAKKQRQGQGRQAAGGGVFQQPAKTVITRINTEVNKALALPDIRAKLDATDNVPTGGTTAEFARQIALESENNARIIRAAGIQGN